ncbi:MAG: hypothetical protein E7184_02795 [Erysipelotrichaceae bacterium]|nr:hypothetical protein [Erysipelotrichaceae bacterium]
MKKGNKNVAYYVFLGIGLAAMVLFATTLLINKFGKPIDFILFDKSRRWLVVSTIYTICVLMYKELLGIKK